MKKSRVSKERMPRLWLIPGRGDKRKERNTRRRVKDYMMEDL